MTTDVNFCVGGFLLSSHWLEFEGGKDTSNIAADKVTRNQIDTQFRCICTVQCPVHSSFRRTSQ